MTLKLNRRRRNCSSRALAAVASRRPCQVAAAPEAKPAAPVLLHDGRTSHHHVYVYQQGTTRFLAFERGNAVPAQSEIDSNDPGRLVTDLQRALVTTAALHGAPKRVLCLGVGGGVVPQALRRMLPAATVDAVDLDGEVIRVAREWFGLSCEDGLRLHVADARSFVRRACAEGQRWDVIILDVFDRHYIPAHLMTSEFLCELGHALESDGLVAINSFAQGRLRDRESRTYAEAFGNFFEVWAGGSNRVIVAYATGTPPDDVIYDNLAAHSSELRRIGICAETAAGHLGPATAWPDDTRRFTDEERQCPELARLRRRAVKDAMFLDPETTRVDVKSRGNVCESPEG